MVRLRLLPGALAALALVSAATLLPGSARAQTAPPGITVRGQGTVSARPDIATITLGATVRRDTAGNAFQRAEEMIAALTATLKAAGIAERDIQTRQFTLQPEYGRSTDGPAPVVGWRAIHTISVKLRDFDRIGATIDTAVRSLGDEATIQGISFGIEDTTAFARRARAAAYADARAKAEEYASAAGVRLGRVIVLDEISSPASTPETSPVADGRGGAVASMPAQIAPGELSLTVIVEVTWAIE